MNQIVGSCQIPLAPRGEIFVFQARLKFLARPIPIKNKAINTAEISAQFADLPLIIGDISFPIISINRMCPIDQGIVEVQPQLPRMESLSQFVQNVSAKRCVSHLEFRQRRIP